MLVPVSTMTLSCVTLCHAQKVQAFVGGVNWGH